MANKLANLIRPLLLGPVALLLSCSDPRSAPATGPASPGAAVPIVPMTPVAAAIDLGTMPLSVDDRGVPHLLRGSTAPAMPAATATASARMHVARLAPAWGVRAAAMPTLEPLGETATPGGTIVRLRQVIDGLPIAATSGGEVHVMVGADGSLVAASGTLFARDTPHAASVTFLDDDAGAVARAVSDVYQTPFTAAALAMTSTAADGSRLLAGTTGPINVSLARARKAWYPSGDTLIAAQVVEAYASDASSTNGDAFRRVIAADDGRVLERVNLMNDAAFSYRVFAETTGELHPFDGPIVDVSPNPTGLPNATPFPPYVTPNLVTIDGLNHPGGGGSAADPWLAAGSVETVGNNVDAYTDLNAPDGLTFGDFRATATAPGAFDRTYNTQLGALASQGQQMAGITSLFYLINWLHDFWYDAGFTEPNGNAQNANFGRGGEDRDAILAEAQDNALGGSRNNANMSTPSDGLPPRMQVFIWDGKSTRLLAISNRTPPTGAAGFGPSTFTTAAAVALASDGAAPASDACTPLVAPVTGKIVLADRGTCTFKTKALNIQNAGGVGMILANNLASVAPPSLGDDPAITTAITIGSLSVLQSEGDAIKADLVAAGGQPVVATIHRDPPGPDLEGTLDATVISHEFAHYVHHRLSVCNTALCGAMSEGWADFDSLLVMSRAGDNLTKAFPVGVYSTMSFPADPVYFGIRRAPYSVSQTINSLSFRHMADGTPLPTDVPFNAGGLNSEVHNAGEVWASMLWEGYVALQQAGGGTFEQIRLKMRQYVVAGLMLAPPNATPTEVRDALLIAARAVSPTDHNTLAAAYARRGFGSCAVSPRRDSVNFQGIVESHDVKGRFVPGALASQLTASCDGDTVLDAGETTRITVPIANPGPVALSNVTVTLTSSLPAVHIATPQVAIGTLAAYSNTTVAFDVRLDDTVTTPLASDLQVQLASSDGCANVSIPIVVPLNTDDRPASSATDTFDAVGSVWRATPGSTVWAHTRVTGLDGLWAGADLGFSTDASLASPPLTAGPGPLTVTFTHRFAFDFTAASGATPATAFDGGVIEMSTDGGVTWQDVSLLVNPGYNQTIPTNSGNALHGRGVYGGTNAAYPGTNDVTMFFGTHLAGKTFQLRFRIGTDASTGAAGWEIDNVVFNGIVGTPFPTLVANVVTCSGGTDGGGSPDAGVPEDGGGPVGDAGPPDDGGPTIDAGPVKDGNDGDDDDDDDDHDDHHHHHHHHHHRGHRGERLGCQVGGSGGAGAGALIGLAAVLLRRRRR